MENGFSYWRNISMDWMSASSLPFSNQGQSSLASWVYGAPTPLISVILLLSWAAVVSSFQTYSAAPSFLLWTFESDPTDACGFHQGLEIGVLSFCLNASSPNSSGLGIVALFPSPSSVPGHYLPSLISPSPPHTCESSQDSEFLCANCFLLGSRSDIISFTIMSLIV